MKCESCGSEIPEGSEFCRECGAKLTQSNITPTVSNNVKCPRIWSKVLIAIIISVVAIFLVVYGVNYYISDVATTVYETDDFAVTTSAYGKIVVDEFADNQTFFMDADNIGIGSITIINNTEYEISTDNDFIEWINETANITKTYHTNLSGNDVLAIDYVNNYNNGTFYTFDKNDRTVMVSIFDQSSFSPLWINSLVFKF